jgi:hypothetical protein
MSVINQMLRDLDKRQGNAGTGFSPPLAPTTTSRRWWWGLLLLPAVWLGVELGARVPELSTPKSAGSESATPVSVSAVSAKTPATTALETQPAHSAESPVANSGMNSGVNSAAVALTQPTLDASALTARNTDGPVAQQGQPHNTPSAAHRADRAVVTPTLDSSAPDADDAEPLAQAHEDAIDTAFADQDGADSDPDSDSDVYALPADTAAFLAEPTAEPVEAAVAVKPQMSMTASDPDRVGQQHLRTQAIQAQAAGRFAEAEAAWLQRIQQLPQLAESYEALAQLYLQHKDFNRLTTLLQRAQQQQIPSTTLQWAQVQLLASAQQWSALLAALTPTLEQQFPQQVLAFEAHAAQQLGQTERALQAYQRWSQRVPQDSRAWLGLGMMLDQAGQLPQAQVAYQTALQLGGLTDASRQFIQQRIDAGTGR